MDSVADSCVGGGWNASVVSVCGEITSATHIIFFFIKHCKSIYTPSCTIYRGTLIVNSSLSLSFSLSDHHPLDVAVLTWKLLWIPSHWVGFSLTLLCVLDR